MSDLAKTLRMLSRVGMDRNSLTGSGFWNKARSEEGCTASEFTSFIFPFCAQAATIGLRELRVLDYDGERSNDRFIQRCIEYAKSCGLRSEIRTSQKLKTGEVHTELWLVW